jgi:hypothetical protein
MLLQFSGSWLYLRIYLFYKSGAPEHHYTIERIPSITAATYLMRVIVRSARIGTAHNENGVDHEIALVDFRAGNMK